MNLARNTLGVLERTALSSLGRRTAIEFDGRSQSFAEQHDRALRLASGLDGIGVRPGDRVAVLLSNRFEWPETLCALAGLGALEPPPGLHSTMYENLIAAGSAQLPGPGPDLGDTAMLY